MSNTLVLQAVLVFQQGELVDVQMYLHGVVLPAVQVFQQCELVRCGAILTRCRSSCWSDVSATQALFDCIVFGEAYFALLLGILRVVAAGRDPSWLDTASSGHGVEDVLISFN